MTSAEVLADSVGPSGVRITSLKLRFPRFLLAQFNTHRAFSRNAASFRARGVNRMVEEVESNPFFPDPVFAEKKGMSGGEALGSNELFDFLSDVSDLRERATHLVTNWSGRVHKQTLNRYLEPWAWADVVVTATDWDNFFRLRLADDAQPEMQELAKAMKAALDGSTPSQLLAAEWHIPFDPGAEWGDQRKRIAIARCARVSYGPKADYDPEKDLDLYDRLRTSGHWSPFEHVAQAMWSSQRRANFRGWLSLRSQLEQATGEASAHAGPV